MTPHHLHALAAAWSLQAARLRLAELARAEAARNTSSLLDAAPVSSPTYGTIHAIGGHGDPTGALLVAPAGRETTWAERIQRSDDRVRWIADQLGDTIGFDPMSRILTAIARLQPGTARLIAQHLRDEDTWVRDTIRQPRPAQPLPGIACPACDHRQLHVQTAGPETAWTVVCAAGCLCVGVGCPCGMPGAVEGVAHIWPRAVVLGAVAGADVRSAATSGQPGNRCSASEARPM